MKLEDPNIADLLDVAREFVEHKQFDASAAINLLDLLAAEDVDVQTIGAIRHARRTALLAYCGSSMQLTIARNALSRVIALLERQALAAAPVNDCGTMTPTRSPK